MEKLKERLGTTKIGFIGGGNMAYAIAVGLIERRVIEKISAVSGPHKENLNGKWAPIAQLITDENWEVNKNRIKNFFVTIFILQVVQKCNVIFLSVKPHMLSTVAEDLKNHFGKFVVQDKVFVSVLAGVTKSQIYDVFNISPPSLRVVRMMPNICVQVGEGCCVVASNEDMENPHGDAEFINYLMSNLGSSEIVPQDQINAYSGLSGSGPAYIFLIIDALADGAVKQGVPRHLAIKFAAQTVCGAAKSVLVTGKHPAVLKDEVCSPGGTTICAIHELEKGGVRASIISAIESASNRAKELLPQK